MRFVTLIPGALLLAVVVLPAAAPGCGADPQPATKGAGAEPPAPGASALRKSFPEHAARVLAGTAPFVVTEEGFATAVATEGTWGGLRVSLPRAGDQAVRVQAGGSFEVRVREVGAEGEGAIAEQAVAYRRAGGTSFWTAAAGGFEEWLHVEAGSTRDGEPVAAWEVEGGTLRQEGALVTIADSEGRVRIRVAAPSAYAASGRGVEARLGVQGSRIELFADARGEEVLVDPSWTAVGMLATARVHFGGALAANGDVVVAGGQGTGTTYLTTAERYNPATQTWTASGTLSAGREWLTVTGVPSLGMVLVAGGQNCCGSFVNADLCNPVAGTCAATTFMKGARATHVAVLLANGKVLVAGGTTFGEVFDPAATPTTWTPTAANITARNWASAALLASGKVLMTGGAGLNTTEIYDPATNAWTAGPNMTTARLWHTMTLLGNGKVLLTGGEASFGGAALSSTELYDPVANTFTAGPTMGATREEHTATLLGSGKVLITGGNTSAQSDLYDPVSNTILATATMTTLRSSHSATLLQNGEVLAASGTAGGAFLSSSEVYSDGPGTPCTSAAQCASGFCADGVCCSTACTGLCQACTAAKKGSGADGACGPVAVGTDPNNNCALQSTATCGTDGFCDGAGACRLYASGTVCVAASCSGTTLSPAEKCNGSGTCVASTPQNCAPFLCAAGPTGPACTTSCTTAAGCAPGSTCTNGKCVGLLGDGQACTTPTVCLSGFCADGVCCHTACNAGVCDACSVAAGAAANGTCALLTGPTCDDGNACTQTDTCQNGVCTGGNPVTCAAMDQCHAAGTCDTATGTCSNPADADGTACDNKDCTAGDTCQAGVCKSGAFNCPAQGPCENVGTCDTGGACVKSLKPDGTACPGGGVCNAGVCQGGGTGGGSTTSSSSSSGSTGSGGSSTSSGSGTGGSSGTGPGTGASSGGPGASSGCKCEAAGAKGNGSPWLLLGLLFLRRGRRARRAR